MLYKLGHILQSDTKAENGRTIQGALARPPSAVDIIERMTKDLLKLSGSWESSARVVDESISDVVDANLAAINRGSGKSMNIGTGEAVSVKRIYELLQGITSYKWDPLYAPNRSGEVYRISLDSSKAKQELGWSPKTTLQEGLQTTVDYFKESIGSSSAR